MPLKLSKVENLLLNNRLLITSFYLLGDRCVFIKVFSIDKGHSFLIKIDSEYKLVITKEQISQRPNINVLFLNSITEEASDTSTVERYGKIPDDDEIRRRYDINFQKNEVGGKEELEANLENNYKKKFFLGDLDQSFKHDHKECKRQLKRLSLSFSDIRYMLSMVYNNLFLYVDDKSKINSFLIREQNTEGRKLLFVIVRLDFFFEDKDRIIKDVITIKKSLFSIVDKTSEANVGNLLLILKKFEAVGTIITEINKIKRTIYTHLEQFEKLIETLVEKEHTLAEEIYVLEESHEKGEINEVAFVHAKRAVEEKKEKAIGVKQRILKNINKTLNQYDDIYLKCDKLEFDNTILLDTLLKNIKEMEEEIEKNVES